MREVLQRLNAVNGMKGSLVVTPDGLPIATDLPAALEIEATAGLGACMGKMITGWAGQTGMKEVALGMLETGKSRLFVSAITWGFLVAVAEKRCPLGEARLEMRNAAARLNEICAGLASSVQEEESRSEPFGRHDDEKP